MKTTRTGVLLWLASAATLLMLEGCERPPVDVIQHGYRGVAMGLVYNPRTVAELKVANEVPAATSPEPAEGAGGPLASSVYKNIQVLDDLNVAQFARLMVAITQWVAPEGESCGYCHGSDMSSDANYRKVVARKMLQMVRYVNSDWKLHVRGTGVTCYTCHRGNGVPQYVWYTDPDPAHLPGMTGNLSAQDAPGRDVGLTSLPSDVYSAFLGSDPYELRVVSQSALPLEGDHKSIKETEWTYGLMIHISESLGVNCTYCHNSRAFTSWDQSTPQRATAWYGIRMVRGINNDYLATLTSVFPANRKGPNGDVAKVNCRTCHQGVYKPLYGVSMLKDYPELAGKATAASDTSPPAGAAPTAN
jgi:photosynthetic reaction center cytochrome c subunit